MRSENGANSPTHTQANVYAKRATAFHGAKRVDAPKCPRGLVDTLAPRTPCSQNASPTSAKTNEATTKRRASQKPKTRGTAYIKAQFFVDTSSTLILAVSGQQINPPPRLFTTFALS